MGILLAALAGLFIPLNSLCTRKSVDVSGNAKAFFLVQMIASFVCAIVLGPLRTGDWNVPLPTLAYGVLTGLVLSLLLFSIGKAVEKGPPGMTFAILNSATVMPGLMMALVFGEGLGFAYNGWHAVGSLIVLAGLFWGVRGVSGIQDKKGWVLFAVLMFAAHVGVLGLYQYRAMLMKGGALTSEWFTPCMMFTSGLVQLAIYLKAVRKIPLRGEVFFGTMGGVVNLLLTFFLIWATEVATPLENAVIFPIYSVIGIILTNAWGQRYYQEKVNWRACQCSAAGLVIGTVDWQAVAAAIGF